MLYELLTGSTPLERAELRNATLAAILKRIREEEPPKLSTRLNESTDALPSISAQRKMEPARLTKGPGRNKLIIFSDISGGCNSSNHHGTYRASI
jgi:hypothetical protein